MIIIQTAQITQQITNRGMARKEIHARTYVLTHAPTHTVTI